MDEDGKVIQLEGPQFTDRDLQSHPELEEATDLILYDTPITDIGLACAARMKTLFNVTIASSLMGDAGFQAFATLRHVISFCVDEAPLLTDRGVAAITQSPELRALYLRKTGITDRCVPHILKASRISSLALDDTAVTDEGVGRLSGLRYLDILSLMGTAVTGRSFSGFENHVLDAYLDRTPMTDNDVELLAAGCPRLNRISLSDTQVGDAACRTLAALKGLKMVRFNRTQVSTSGILEFLGHPSLETIEASECSVPPRIAKQLKAASSVLNAVYF